MKFFDHSTSKFPLSSVLDYRSLARRRIPALLFDFLEGGAFDEVTLSKNRNDFKEIQLKRRVLKNISNINTSTQLFDQNIDFPLLLSPVGFAGIFAPRGELQAAKAAKTANIPFALSAMGICSMEEIAEETAHPFWFQLYPFKEKEFSLEILQRTKSTNCPVLLVTVDIPISGARYRYQRSSKKSLFNFVDVFKHLPWWANLHLRGGPITLGNIPEVAKNISGFSNSRRWMAQQLQHHFTWKDLKWIRDQWKGRLVIKGILDPEDALLALEMGVDGIIVSNHGGRHFDSTLSTIKALPPICQAINGKIPILIDGGITNGLDIIKALTLGADACMIGKSWVYGLAARGESGVSEILNILKQEIKIAMSHLGISSIQEINRSLLIS